VRIIAWRAGPYDNGSYLVADENGDAILVDPAMDERRALAAVRDAGLRLLEILNTHGHPDHVAANAAVKEATRARLAIHRADAYRLAMDASSSGFVVPSSVPDDLIDEGPLTLLRDVELVALHTPGHTEGSTCFHLPAEGVLFSGDVLFAGAVGRVDLPGGDAGEMTRSLARLLALPGQTRVYPGHGAPTTLASEAPWLRELSLT
jgi:hydroxyacylglutathione hydrolase